MEKRRNPRKIGRRTMTNAKQEFLTITKGLKVINITMWTEDRNNHYALTYFDLLEGYSLEDYEEFLHKINFNYSSGYGGQELFGLIGCENNIWFDRGEYDGSEWWERHKYPNIDKIIKNRILDKLENEQ